MLTFQHIGTARHRGDENTMDVMLYGRQADGTSTAVHVKGITAYGFVRTRLTSAHQRVIGEWVRWVTSMQRSDRNSAKYKKEHDEKKPNDEVLNYWQWCHSTAKLEPGDIVWEQTAGFNIRYVRDVEPPAVHKFTVRRYDVWRALLSIFKEPEKVYTRIQKFRATMLSFVPETGKQHVPGMPGTLDLRGSQIYETMFQPEIVWMVDHQLPAC